MFNDKEVDKKVKYKLGIFDGSEPSEADLDKITEIIISNLNARGEEIGTDISELSRLRKLKTLDLKGFDLTEEVIRVIHSFPELVGLRLYSCHSKEPVHIDIEKLKSLILDHCQSMNLSQMKLPESVLIVDCGMVDVSRLQGKEDIKDLGIKNSDIINSDSFREMSSLKSLNVDGSTLDDDEVVSKLRNKRIAVSNEFEYHPLR